MPLDRALLEKLQSYPSDRLTCKTRFKYKTHLISQVERIVAGSPDLASFLELCGRLLERLSQTVSTAHEPIEFQVTIQPIGLELSNDVDALHQLRLFILEDFHDLTDYQNVKSAPKCR